MATYPRGTGSSTASFQSQRTRKSLPATGTPARHWGGKKKILFLLRVSVSKLERQGQPKGRLSGFEKICLQGQEGGKSNKRRHESNLESQRELLMGCGSRSFRGQ